MGRTSSKYYLLCWDQIAYFWYTRLKKRWIELFKVFMIANADIIVNMGNSSIIFRISKIRLYNDFIERIYIIYRKPTDSLTEISVVKLANKKIPMVLNYWKSQKSHQYKQLQKRVLIDDLIDETTILFIVYTIMSFHFNQDLRE